MASDVIKRGDIYRVNLELTLGSEQQGRARPCVVLSITPFNKQFKTVGVVPLSSSARVHEPVSVSVPSAGEGAVALGDKEGRMSKVLLQIFSGTVLGPIFFEFIQRKKDEGFGEGNFTALFKSIERDQIERGALQVAEPAA